MRVLAIQPSVLGREMGIGSSPRIFPWGFASVLTRVHAAGHEIVMLDVYGQHLAPEEVQSSLDALTFDCLFITGYVSMTFGYVEWLSREVRKRSSAPIVIGGLLADLHSELLLKNRIADFCVIGEGIESGVELFRNFDRPEIVNGIAFKRAGRVVRTTPRSCTRDLAEIEMPNFELFELKPYLYSPMSVHSPSARYCEYPLKHKVKLEDLFPNFAIFAGKGCPYRCLFCARSSDQVKLRPVPKILTDVAELKARYGIRAVQFKDELLIVNKERTRQLCYGLGKLSIYWECQSRVDTLDEATLKLMSEAGCISVGLGVESGSDRMLHAMGKRISRHQIIDILQAARRVGIHVRLQLMCGFPGEDAASMKETATLFLKTGIPPRPISWCTPMPGSVLYSNVQRDGRIGDEAAYLRVALDTNKPERIVLNVSGLNDVEMSRLYDSTHLTSELYYIFYLVKNPYNWLCLSFWEKVYRYVVARDLYLQAAPRPSPRSGRLRLAIYVTGIINLALGTITNRKAKVREIRNRSSVRDILFDS